MSGTLLSTTTRFEVTHIVDFDIGPLEESFFHSSRPLEALEEILAGIYRVSDDTYATYQVQNTQFLRHYQYHFQKRIKPEVRANRGTIVAEFQPIHATGLATSDDVLIPNTEPLQLLLTASLNRLGVGTLVSRLPLPQTDIVALAACSRDPSNLLTTVDDPGTSYAGFFSLSDLLRLVICELLETAHSQRRVPQTHHHDIALQYGNVAGLHASIVRRLDGSSVSTVLNCWPVFFLESSLPAASLSDALDKDALELRALLTGDVNWAYKRPELVKEHLKKIQFGSRVSAPWFVSADATVYVLASDFETDFREAKCLVVFELEVLIALRHYLYRVNRMLHQVQVRPSSFINITEMREEAIRNLDEFFSLEISHKDTTRRRLESCMNSMGISALREATFKRLDAVTQKLNVHFQKNLVDKQVILTILFGVLGFGFLTIEFQTLMKTGQTWYKNPDLAVPLAVMLFIYLLLRRAFST